MASRSIGLLSFLRHELTRLGRITASVTLEPDERSVTLQDCDGSWQGSIPAAFGALVWCGADRASTAEFWQIFRSNE